ncbi:HAD family hydrolase [Chloroflexota bacterium]
MTPATNQQKIRAIATDLDGTLLTTAHTITPRTERALKQAMQQGVKVIIATGKTAASRELPVRQLGLTTPGVYSQGLVLINADGTIRYQRDMEPAAAHAAIAFAEDECGCNVVVVLEAGTRIITNSLSTLTQFMTDHHEQLPTVVPSLREAIKGVPVTKLIIERDPAYIEQTRAALAQRLNNAAELVLSMPQLLEILPPGASKGDGLRRLLADLDIDPVHVLALGDGENDIEMLQMVGIGVAMGNANERVKAATDHITASNDEDGVGLAVEKYILAGSN